MALNDVRPTKTGHGLHRFSSSCPFSLLNSSLVIVGITIFCVETVQAVKIGRPENVGYQSQSAYRGLGRSAPSKNIYGENVKNIYGENIKNIGEKNIYSYGKSSNVIEKEETQKFDVNDKFADYVNKVQDEKNVNKKLADYTSKNERNPKNLADYTSKNFTNPKKLETKKTLHTNKTLETNNLQTNNLEAKTLETKKTLQTKKTLDPKKLETKSLKKQSAETKAEILKAMESQVREMKKTNDEIWKTILNIDTMLLEREKGSTVYSWTALQNSPIFTLESGHGLGPGIHYNNEGKGGKRPEGVEEGHDLLSTSQDSAQDSNTNTDSNDSEGFAHGYKYLILRELLEKVPVEEMEQVQRTKKTSFSSSNHGQNKGAKLSKQNSTQPQVSTQPLSTQPLSKFVTISRDLFRYSSQHPEIEEEMERKHNEIDRRRGRKQVDFDAVRRGKKSFDDIRLSTKVPFLGLERALASSENFERVFTDVRHNDIGSSTPYDIPSHKLAVTDYYKENGQANLTKYLMKKDPYLREEYKKNGFSVSNMTNSNGEGISISTVDLERLSQPEKPIRLYQTVQHEVKDREGFLNELKKLRRLVVSDSGRDVSQDFISGRDESQDFITKAADSQISRWQALLEAKDNNYNGANSTTRTISYSDLLDAAREVALSEKEYDTFWSSSHSMNFSSTLRVERKMKNLAVIIINAFSEVDLYLKKEAKKEQQRRATLKIDFFVKEIAKTRDLISEMLTETIEVLLQEIGPVTEKNLGSVMGSDWFHEKTLAGKTKGYSTHEIRTVFPSDLVPTEESEKLGITYSDFEGGVQKIGLKYPSKKYFWPNAKYSEYFSKNTAGQWNSKTGKDGKKGRTPKIVAYSKNEGKEEGKEKGLDTHFGAPSSSEWSIMAAGIAGEYNEDIGILRTWGKHGDGFFWLPGEDFQNVFRQDSNQIQGETQRNNATNTKNKNSLRQCSETSGGLQQALYTYFDSGAPDHWTSFVTGEVIQNDYFESLKKFEKTAVKKNFTEFEAVMFPGEVQREYYFIWPAYLEYKGLLKLRDPVCDDASGNSNLHNNKVKIAIQNLLHFAKSEFIPAVKKLQLLIFQARNREFALARDLGIHELDLGTDPEVILANGLLNYIALPIRAFILENFDEETRMKDDEDRKLWMEVGETASDVREHRNLFWEKRREVAEREVAGENFEINNADPVLNNPSFTDIQCLDFLTFGDVQRVSFMGLANMARDGVNCAKKWLREVEKVEDVYGRASKWHLLREGGNGGESDSHTKETEKIIIPGQENFRHLSKYAYIDGSGVKDLVPKLEKTKLRLAKVLQRIRNVPSLWSQVQPEVQATRQNKFGRMVRSQESEDLSEFPIAAESSTNNSSTWNPAPWMAQSTLTIDFSVFADKFLSYDHVELPLDERLYIDHESGKGSKSLAYGSDCPGCFGAPSYIPALGYMQYKNCGSYGNENGFGRNYKERQIQMTPMFNENEKKHVQNAIQMVKMIGQVLERVKTGDQNTPRYDKKTGRILPNSAVGAENLRIPSNTIDVYSPTNVNDERSYYQAKMFDGLPFALNWQENVNQISGKGPKMMNSNVLSGTKNSNVSLGSTKGSGVAESETQQARHFAETRHSISRLDLDLNSESTLLAYHNTLFAQKMAIDFATRFRASRFYAASSDPRNVEDKMPQHVSGSRKEWPDTKNRVDYDVLKYRKQHFGYDWRDYVDFSVGDDAYDLMPSLDRKFLNLGKPIAMSKPDLRSTHDSSNGSKFHATESINEVPYASVFRPLPDIQTLLDLKKSSNSGPDSDSVDSDEEDDFENNPAAFKVTYSNNLNPTIKEMLEIFSDACDVLNLTKDCLPIAKLEFQDWKKFYYRDENLKDKLDFSLKFQDALPELNEIPIINGRRRLTKEQKRRVVKLQKSELEKFPEYYKKAMEQQGK